jgi:hypothetical protein
MPTTKPELLKLKRQRYRALHPESRQREYASQVRRGLMPGINARRRMRYVDHPDPRPWIRFGDDGRYLGRNQ